MMPNVLKITLAALALCIAALPAIAQVGTDTRPPDAPGPTVPSQRPGESLSDRLNRSDGVIPPTQNIDPGLTKPAPDTGTTPVIPPPDAGTGVQPK